MDYKKAVSDAVKQSEKEKQEYEVSKIKKVVEAYLETILHKKEAIKTLQKELKALENDLDDLKAGRLDKIEERQGLDPMAKEQSLIVIKRVEDEYLPYQPWKSPYMVEWKYHLPFTTYHTTFSRGTMNMVEAINATNAMIDKMLRTTGIMFQNFTGGTYDINGHIINL